MKLLLAVITYMNLIILSMANVNANVNGDKKNIFLQTIKEAKNFFTPHYKKRNIKLTIEHDWEYDENNAKAMAYTVDHYFIELYGGALKAPGTNKDSFRAMICHEVGHHLGGIPLMPEYYRDFYLFRGSSEGQADYYAASKCLKEWFNGEDHWKALRKYGFNTKDEVFCRNYYQSANEVGLCIRIITAMKRMVGFDIKKTVNLQIKKPNPSYPYMLASSVTHPEDECRVETVYAGVICNGYDSYGCKFNSIRPEASRPLCWVGLQEILETEYANSSKRQKFNILNKLKSYKIKEFHTNQYDDDDVAEQAERIKVEFKKELNYILNGR